MRKIYCEEVNPTKMRLKLEDMSFVYPYGIKDDIDKS